MSHHHKSHYRENSQRRQSPDYRRSSSSSGHQISDADTSIDYHRDRDSRPYESRRQHSCWDHHRSSQKRSYNHYNRDSSKDSFKSTDRSFEQSRDSNYTNRETRASRLRDDPRNQRSFDLRERPKNQQKQHQRPTEYNIQREKGKICNAIQRLDYQSLSHESLKEKFIECCREHLKFSSDFPESCDQIGTLLLKDGIFLNNLGLFHEMWSLVVFKNPKVASESLAYSYYSLFRPMIEKNLTNFEKAFNNVPEEAPSIHENSIYSLKRDREVFQESTRSTTRSKIMVLYEEIKGEIKKSELQKSMMKKLEESVAEFKIKIDQNFSQIEDPYNIEWFDSAKAMEKINKQEEAQMRQAEVEKAKKLKLRERSPLSNRFRMMHEIQSNQRRSAVEMACVFLKLNTFYHFNEIHIVKVDEVIMSETQEILVVKAYSLELCPLTGKLKLEPKLKNLIAVYKFCNLTELIRLVQTHGEFNGIIVYPECFNVKKYLATSEELSLLKSECLDQVKEDMKEIIKGSKYEQSFEY